MLALQYKSSYVFALPSTSSILIVNLKSCMTKNDDQRQDNTLLYLVSFIIRDEEAVNSHFSSGDLQRRKDALVIVGKKELEREDCITVNLIIIPHLKNEPAT